MTSREPSAAPSSAGEDTIEERVEHSRLAPADGEETASISDLPARTATPSSIKGTKRPRSGARKPRPKKGAHVWVNEGAEGTEDESTPVKIKKSDSVEPDSRATVGTRRQANGTVGSVYSGSKIRHIKKPDGIPLWRSEIQYAFLHEVVHDEKRVFTRLRDGKKHCTFSEIYVDCLARSSKTSLVLKGRLAEDIPAAQNMAMICLLVNVGRMNTTLNFFPEMRAQLRTYHPIPALQAHPTQKDYKMLQDAPRLKSILKGASEDEEQPRTLPQLRDLPVPRTNPVNVIFVLSQAANEISQSHFLDKIDFFDLAIRPTISSHTRAVAFLWLMWYYLESDFSKEAALNNPYGPGEYKDGEDSADPTVVPLLVPKFDHISEEEGQAENVDTSDEVAFGERMTKERERINAKFAEEDAQNEANGKEIEHKGVKRLKRTARELGDDMDSSDVDSRASPGASARSPAPGDTPRHSSTAGLQADSLEDEWEAVDAHPGRGRYKRPRGKGTPSRRTKASDIGVSGSVSRAGGRSRLGLASDRGTPDTNRGTPQPIMPPGVNHPILTQFPRPSRPESSFDLAHLNANGMTASSSKSRARTGYQRELEAYKQRRVDKLVRQTRKKLLKEERKKREEREKDGAGWLLQTMKEIESLPEMYDSEEDDTAKVGLSFLGPQFAQKGTGLGGILRQSKRANKPAVSKEDSNENGHGASLKDENDGRVLDPYGEEAEFWKHIFQRTQRRLYTWSGDKDVAAFMSQQAAEQERDAVPPPQSALLGKNRPTSGGDGSIMIASSVANSTPRKPRHDSRRSLEAEIDEDLLRSADEDDGEDEEGDVDGDTPMIEA